MKWTPRLRLAPFLLPVLLFAIATPAVGLVDPTPVLEVSPPRVVLRVVEATLAVRAAVDPGRSPFTRAR